MTREELREKANDLPLVPGVYLMMDKTGKVIYVGKAKKLKNRVSQYFQDSASHTAKTRHMVSQVDHFDTIFVTSEFEALVLENSLIKRHMPRYNILLKDDKGYPFVRLSTRGLSPLLPGEPDRPMTAPGTLAPSAAGSRPARPWTRCCAALRLPTCSRKFPRDIGAERPCLNFHMGRCDGFCRPEMTAEEYNRRIEQAVQLLEGKSKQLLREHDRRDGGGGGGPALRAGGAAPGPDQRHRCPQQKADGDRRPLRRYGHLGTVPGIRQELLRHSPHGGGQSGRPGDGAVLRPQRRRRRPRCSPP